MLSLLLSSFSARGSKHISNFCPPTSTTEAASSLVSFLACVAAVDRSEAIDVDVRILLTHLLTRETSLGEAGRAG